MQQEMTTTVNKDSLLQKLEENRSQHKKIVEEARDGYIKKARKALEEKLKKLQEGKIVSLIFNLQPPQDHTKDYDVAIEMVKSHTEETMVLTTSQFKTLYMDQWHWTDLFLVSNSSYSQTAQNLRNDE